MKSNLPAVRPAAANPPRGDINRILYRRAIWIASLSCGSAALAQSSSLPAPPGADAGGSTNVTKLENVTVVGKLDVARNQIVPDLGATTYRVSKDQIASIAGGENAPFNQVLLRTPGIAQDSLGQLHIRGEHANLQYRINDVLLPEGITGFGSELDTRFVESMRLITGSLPAQYGFRTAGIVDLQTKSGAFENGGEASLYGGSYDTLRPSAEYGGAKGNWNYFFNASYTHDALGIENPTPASSAIHDDTDQFRAFTYLSYVFDDTSRISVMGSASYSDFQLPNTPGLAAGNLLDASNPSAVPWFSAMNPATTNINSIRLNENQNEQNYYGVVAYQKSVNDFNLQVAGYGRSSSVHFTPDPFGDLFFDGVASDVDRTLYSAGVQADASYGINDKHTLRGGLMVLEEQVSTHSTTTVFPVDADGNPTGAPFPIIDNSVNHALFGGVYLQDEWKVLPKVTLNVGARFDIYYASADHENQPSPRVNLIWEPTDTTTLHLGYARYFTPPALENVPSTSVHKFDNTSNGAAVTQDDPAKAERANYYDAGITQKLAPGLQVGVDGYYKTAKNQLDDGYFGASLIPSNFNYAEGRVYGVEFTGTYTHGGFSSYANLAWSVAQGKNWSSAQFQFDPADLAYVKNNWVYLDHDQRVTGSFGVSYLWQQTSGSTRFFADALYGSGLRTDASETLAGGGSRTIPNGGSVPAYYTVNLGAEQIFKLKGKQALRARFEVVNVTDNVYELRDGGGIGVNAAQFGMRLGFFGTLAYSF